MRMHAPRALTQAGVQWRTYQDACVQYAEQEPMRLITRKTAYASDNNLSCDKFRFGQMGLNVWTASATIYEALEAHPQVAFQPIGI